MADTVGDLFRQKFEPYVRGVAEQAALQNAAFREKDIRAVARAAAKESILPYAIAASGIGAVAFLLGAGALIRAIRRT